MGKFSLDYNMNKELIMLKKEWNSTGGLKRGLFAEYYAAMQLMLYGFEVYKTIVDDRGIDYIIRKPKGVFYEIQVKSVTPPKTGSANIKIDKDDKFDIKNKEPQYGLRLPKKNRDSLQEYKLEKYIGNMG